MPVTRKDVPAYFQWRGGRPRWEPGPSLRLKGFKGQDLKAENGAWLTRGAAIDLADMLNAATRDPASPSGYAGLRARTVSHLIAELQATRKFRLDLGDAHKGRKKRRLKPRTLSQYKMHLGIIEQWCGDIPVAGLPQKAIEDWYETLIETRGLAMANATMRVFRLALNYAKDVLEWVDRNRVAAVELEDTDGRRVVWSAAEIAAFIAMADALDMPEYGDAVLIGAVTGLRQGDLLTLPRLNLEANGNLIVLTGKTGRPARVPAVRQFRRRILAARARLAAASPGVTQMTEIVCTRTLKPYTDGSAFREGFRTVRLYAAGFAHALADAGFAPCAEFTLGPAVGRTRGPAAAGEALRRSLAVEPAPSLLDKQWGDLRDTSVTWLVSAGCTDAEIATVQGRSLVSVKSVIDKHYLVRDDGMARAGAAKLETFLDAAGVKW